MAAKTPAFRITGIDQGEIPAWFPQNLPARIPAQAMVQVQSRQSRTDLEHTLPPQIRRHARTDKTVIDGIRRRRDQVVRRPLLKALLSFDR